MPHPLDPAWNMIDRKKSHLISIGWLKGSAKLCKIQFHKDGFFVHFPFHPDTHGTIAFCTLRPGDDQMHLTEHGGVVSHKVKYSHHGDGTCLFSQDGKVRSVVRTALGKPLVSDEMNRADHLFSIDVQGLEHFPAITEEERCSDKVGRGFFDVAVEDPPVIHLAARWKKIDPPERIASMRNPIGGKLPTGEMRPLLGLSPPLESPLYGNIMLIDVGIRERLRDEPDDPFLLAFTGGFAPGLADPSVESSSIVMMYPAGPEDTLPNFDYIESA
jgi:hypothetical protein